MARCTVQLLSRDGVIPMKTTESGSSAGFSSEFLLRAYLGSENDLKRLAVLTVPRRLRTEQTTTAEL